MNKRSIVKFLIIFGVLCWIAEDVHAQRRNRRATRRTTNTQTRANITSANTAQMPQDTVPTPAAVVVDTLPIKTVKKSLRLDQAVDTFGMTNREPLAYEYLRYDDAAMRHRLLREIDGREKINMPFRYAADEDNGNQRFISILLQAVKDSAVTVFNAIDDRFTTPMTMGEVSAEVAGPLVSVPNYDAEGNLVGEKYMRNEVSLDSFYKFRIKEEVVWDKRTSRLYWRILGIAPVAKLITSTGLDLGYREIFWVYYPDLRKTLSNYQVYNAKNLGGRMTWEELFESRMFSGRIIKTSMDNPFDLKIENYKGYQDQPILQLMEGENVKDKIFNYEQDLWEY